MKKIALMGSGLLSKEFALRAKELGIESHCFSYDKYDIACKYVDYFHEVDLLDKEALIIECGKCSLDGVVATTELTILPTAEVAKALGLLGNEVSVAKDITNKLITRLKVAQAKLIMQPKFWNYVSGDYPSVDTFPVIVKPIAAGGKRGISVVYNKQELIESIKLALPYSKVKGVIIEEYLDGGMEYSVESLSYKGEHYVVQITQKDSSGPPHCFELGHHQPASITREMAERVKDAISETLDLVGITNGTCHTEIKIINGLIFLIEINARPGGDQITYPLTELSTGYPYLSGIMWAALGELEGHMPLDLKSYHSGIYFVTDQTAYLKPIFMNCENYRWLYKKHEVSSEPTKIVFNDEENLNYFIYFDKDKKPDISSLLHSLITKG